MASCRATVRSASPAAAVSVPLRPPSLAAAPRPTPTAAARAYTAPRSGSRAVVALRAGIARGTPDTESDSRVGACSRTRDTTPAPPGCVATVARVRSLSPLLVTPPARLASRVTLRCSIWLQSISTGFSPRFPSLFRRPSPAPLLRFLKVLLQNPSGGGLRTTRSLRTRPNIS